MKKLRVELEHCYGIKKLEAEFDFQTNGDAVAIYAPNGTMKTSFANTFRDFSKGGESLDRIWESNKTKRLITDENGDGLVAESVFVIEPFNQDYRSDRISTLLVNDELRKQYDFIHVKINEDVETLVNALKSFADSKTNIMEEFATSITHDPQNFYLALTRVESEVTSQNETPLGDVIYSDIFNPKVKPILEDPEFKKNIQNYMQKYDELLSNSTFFKKGVFTHNNAEDIAKNLDTNGFFKASHSVFLRIKGEKTEIGSLGDLKSAIQTEKNLILTDKDLESAFDKIDKQLMRNVDLRKFRSCLEENPIVLGELTNPERLRQNLWVEYLIRSKDSYLDLLSAYGTGKKGINKILAQARDERTKWAEVINIFNERFSVPFVVRIGNQEDVILKRDTPSICFDFLEDPDDKNSESIEIEKSALNKVLSNGESRALYILNIIFEVEARKKADQNTLFIVDDIADSFDYKNKYAIIEYLMEIKNHPGFQQIIMSHNFDFYRTVSSRLDLPREGRILVSKAGDKIDLQEDKYKKLNPFSHWSEHLSDDSSMLVAAIPFLRNLADFSGYKESYETLTSLLHIKADTDTFTISNLEGLIKQILHNQSNLSLSNQTGLVKDLIYQVADRIANDAFEQSSLEDKITLSIAIRLKAEEFMIEEINDESFWHEITNNQTIRLINRFKHNFSDKRECIQILEQVNLMTPENIHLNSFMYEPILDLSAQHLKKLFLKVDAL